MARYTEAVASTARAGVTRGRTKRRSRSPRWWRITKIILAVTTIGLLIGVGAVFGFFFYIRGQAAKMVVNLDDLVQGEPPKPSVIFAVDGTKLYETIPERRDPITLKEVPEYVQNAILAAEDVRFRTRASAIDYESLGRAVFGKARGINKGGGSTLSMQLAKLKYSKSEYSMQRKIQDMAIAQAMDERLTRDQILELYLNDVYFGEGATGIAAAAKTYFNKSVAKLSYAEAAMLARCVRRPSDQNPVRNYAKALENGHVVLNLMRNEGWISEEKYGYSIKEKPRITRPAERTVAPIKKAGYFVSSVLTELKARGIDITTGGYTVHTTLDLQLQGRVEEEVRNIVNNHRGEGVNTAAFLLVDRDGHILAMQGGLDYRKNHYNVVTMGGLQPGSAFKPVVYATALERGTITEYSDISNAPIKVKTGRHRYWTPHNSGRWGNSSYPLETAFKYSINLPAIHTIQQVGPKEVVQYATDRFGYEPGPKKPMLAVPSLALGTCQVTPIEMAQAYSVFMTGGTRVKPYAIERVIGPDGTVVLQNGPTRFENVLKPETCTTIDRLMEAVVQSGTGKEARSVEGARGKTGTTNDAKDAWFCGYAQGLIGIGWIGNERNGKRYAMEAGVFGGTVTVEMWRGVMRGAVAKFGTRFATPSPSTEEQPRRRRRREDPDAENAPMITTTDETNDDPVANAPAADANAAPVVDDPPTTPPAAPANEAPVVEDPAPPKPRPEREPRDKPERTEPKPRSTSRSTDEGTVEVEVCADSGARATAYCPETVTRTFPRGKAPRQRCPLHRGTG